MKGLFGLIALLLSSAVVAQTEARTPGAAELDQQFLRAQHVVRGLIPRLEKAVEIQDVETMGAMSASIRKTIEQGINVAKLNGHQAITEEFAKAREVLASAYIRTEASTRFLADRFLELELPQTKPTKE